MTIQIEPAPAPEGQVDEPTPSDSIVDPPADPVVSVIDVVDRGHDVLQRPVPVSEPASPSTSEAGEVDAALEVAHLNVYYGSFRAIKDVGLTIRRHAVTAIIGPSGCGKSTFLRTLNRMHELTPTARAGTCFCRSRTGR